MKKITRRVPMVEQDWFAEHLEALIEKATEEYLAHGRGCVVIDEARRFSRYSPQSAIPVEQEDATRMVAAYNPAAEAVVILLKPSNLMSVTRIGSRARGSAASGIQID